MLFPSIKKFRNGSTSILKTLALSNHSRLQLLEISWMNVRLIRWEC